MPTLRTPEKKKRKVAQHIIEGSEATPNKRRCSESAGNTLTDSQSFVDAVMSTRVVTVQADVIQEDETLSQMLQPSQEIDSVMHVSGLISKLSADIHKMFNDVHDKMDKMAGDIEQRLSKKFSQMLDKRLNTEVSKMRKEVHKEIDSAKDDLREDIKSLQNQLDERPVAAVTDNQSDLNIIIRNLSESVGEDLEKKVGNLLRDGLKLRNTSFSKVERKGETRRGKPGVVVMTCRSKDERQQILQNKKQLRDTRAFRDVNVHPDQSYEARRQASNFKTLISALQSEIPGLRLQGTRVMLDSGDRRRSNNGRHDRPETHGTRASQSGQAAGNDRQYNGYRGGNSTRQQNGPQRDQQRDHRHNARGKRRD